MCLSQGPQRSDAGEARTRSPSVTSQALCYRARHTPLFNNFDVYRVDVYQLLVVYYIQIKHCQSLPV